MSLGGERKRAFSTPHITAHISRMFNTTSADNFYDFDKRMNYSHKMALNMPPIENDFYDDSGSQWSMPSGHSESNIYTSLAMGDDRFKLPTEMSTRESSIGLCSTAEEEDKSHEDEAMDQFSPTLYSLSRTHSIPIPISAGNSPQHHGPSSGFTISACSSGHQTPNVCSPTHLAYSASPVAAPQAFSPFFSCSPDPHTQSMTQLSQSYDQAVGLSVNRLPLPARRHTQPQSTRPRLNQSHAPSASSLTTNLENASAILFATSPTSSVYRLAAH